MNLRSDAMVLLMRSFNIEVLNSAHKARSLRSSSVKKTILGEKKTGRSGTTLKKMKDNEYILSTSYAWLSTSLTRTPYRNDRGSQQKARTIAGLSGVLVPT